MQTILLLTTIYPLPSLKNQGTSTCHYFTREWVRMGYNVRVVHFQTVYPILFYLLARLFKKIIVAKTGSVVYTNREYGIVSYVSDGVEISRLPIFKWIPHGKYEKAVINKQVSNIIQINKNGQFVPDFIIGHFPNPQLEIIAELRKYYPLSKTSIIMHGDNGSLKRVYKDNYLLLIKKIDVWGFRSKSIQIDFEKQYGKMDKSFICLSGIPEEMILKNNNRNFRKRLSRFIFIGEMIKRKYPTVLISSIRKVYTDKDFHIVYVGDGQEIISIKEKIRQFSLADNVTFTGNIRREAIIPFLDESECFIMISRDEAFGLVYLEAMARGCITIGARDEGIDGVIIPGFNGFLCEAGNTNELAKIIEHINSLTPEERKRISDNAIFTANDLTDYKAALRYILNIRNL